MHLFPVNCANTAVNYTLPKARLFGLHFCGRQHGSNVDHFDAAASQSYKIK